jgi:hypothetical protein
VRSGTVLNYQITSTGKGEAGTFQVGIFPSPATAARYDRVFRRAWLGAASCRHLPQPHPLVPSEWLYWCAGALPGTGGNVDLRKHTATIASGLVFQNLEITTFVYASVADSAHVVTADLPQGLALTQDLLGRVRHDAAHRRTTPLSLLLERLYTQLTACKASTGELDSAVKGLEIVTGFPSSSVPTVRAAATAHHVCQAIIDGFSFPPAASAQLKGATAAAARRLSSVLGETRKMAAACSGGAAVIGEDLQNPQGRHAHSLSDGIAAEEQGLAQYPQAAVDIAELIPQYRF